METPAQVIAQLARGPATIRALTDAVPPRDLRRRRAPGRWSAHEHAVHVALMEPMWAERLERILRETNPTIISYQPDRDDAPDRLLGIELDGALRDLEAGRARLGDRLAGLSPVDWSRPARHTGHARYSLFLMARHLALHDLLHAYRIEESALGTHWPSDGLDSGPA